jgi:hypothetical protein
MQEENDTIGLRVSWKCGEEWHLNDMQADLMEKDAVEYATTQMDPGGVMPDWANRKRIIGT